MRLILLILFSISSTFCFSQNKPFNFRASTEIGYLLNDSKKSINYKPPFSYTFKTGVSIHMDNFTELGMLINISYIRYNINTGFKGTLPSYPSLISELINKTEGLIIGPTAFIEHKIAEKTSLSIHSSYLLPATAKTDRYFYSEELDIVTDPVSSPSIDNTPSQLTLQFKVIYDIIRNDKIELGIKPFFRYHITLNSSIEQEIDNLHYVGLGLNLRSI